MIDWILKNKEWLLSGLGITIIGFIVKWLTMLFDKSPKPVLEIEIPQVFGTKQLGEIRSHLKNGIY